MKRACSDEFTFKNTIFPFVAWDATPSKNVLICFDPKWVRIDKKYKDI